MKKVIVTLTLVLAASTSFATSKVIPELAQCLVVGDGCSMDLKVKSNEIAEAILNGSLTAQEAAAAIKAIGEQAERQENKKVSK